jgi:hypothetical protein
VDGQRAQVEYQRFSTEYFSGCDVAIYFGDVWVDDIVSIDFTLAENVAPLYGYASYTYDAVARGTRLINGRFVIAFKESYYIPAIANDIAWKMKHDELVEKPFEFQSTHMEDTIEGILSAAKNMARDEFEDMADEYEKSLWGGSSLESMNSRVAEQERTSYFYPDNPNSHRQGNLHKVGFNIMITYGAMERETEISGNQHTAINHTVHTLVGVQLTGVSTQISPTGEPVYEIYDFMARDLDGDFTKQGK